MGKTEGDRAAELRKAFVRPRQTDDENCVHTVVRGLFDGCGDERMER